MLISWDRRYVMIPAVPYAIKIAMQTYLTLLFELIFVTGGGYVAIDFLLGLLVLWQRCSPDHQMTLAPSEDAKPVPFKALPAASEEKVPLEPIPMGELKRAEVETTRSLVDEMG